MNRIKYNRIFEPIKLAGTIFQNRLFASPQDTYRLTYEGFLDDNATAFYEVKAMGGFASVCVGDVMIDARSGHSHPFQLNAADVKSRVSLTRTASAITRHSVVAAAELNHAGKNSNVMAEKEGFVYGLVDEMRPDGIEIRAMDEAWIEQLIKYYADTAAFVVQCGFGMITLHGGHGWLIGQFMSPYDNKRTDKWGGSLENRMRFPLAVIDAVRRRVGKSIPIEIRISGTEGVEGGIVIEEAVEMAKMMDEKVDLLHISAGHHEIPASYFLSHPAMFDPDGVNVKYAAQVKKHVSTPVATVGALTDPDMMEEVIASGKADVLALGRQTLADPDLPVKSRTGHEDEINQCLRCYTCFSTSATKGIFYCATNPLIGHEHDSLNENSPRYKKKVLVVGGGIAGMQAALTAAQRGHEVTLCEKKETLGGVLVCEKDVQFKEKLGIYIERQKLRLSRSTVDVQLGINVTPEYVKTKEPDVIIAALGSRQIVPPVKGIEGDNVYSAEEIYEKPDLAGQSVMIMGGGLVGLELGIFLAQKDRKVTVVEMLPDTIASPRDEKTSKMMSDPKSFKPDSNVFHGQALEREIKKLPEMSIMTSTKVIEITEKCARVINDNIESELFADTFIYAVGMDPQDKEAFTLHDCAPEFYQIGDCARVGTIVDATQKAYQVAKDIGRIV
jgi:2,4-dienoyl-CoA reductase-like NADH-dependent reductase (Old Yellow Enzyme family)/thioredoxin reductase